MSWLGLRTRPDSAGVLISDTHIQSVLECAGSFATVRPDVNHRVLQLRGALESRLTAVVDTQDDNQRKWSPHLSRDQGHQARLSMVDLTEPFERRAPVWRIRHCGQRR